MALRWEQLQWNGGAGGITGRYGYNDRRLLEMLIRQYKNASRFTITNGALVYVAFVQMAACKYKNGNERSFKTTDSNIQKL
uniref:Uncharacterized protein n=1 Tax=Romanomermis culicivorax TaxID=13658 RepID=A0A915L6H4_ROMCU